MWEFYEDEGMWIVRPVNYSSYEEYVEFHTITRDEAIALSAKLNEYELMKGVH